MRLRTNKPSESVGEMFFYGSVDGTGWFGHSPTDVLDAIAELGPVETLRLYINSFGGDAFAGIAIYQLLRRVDARLEIIVDGIAASAASVIAMAGAGKGGTTVRRGAMIMIHNAGIFAGGNKKDLKAWAETLAKLDESVVAIYAARPGADKAAIRAAMDGEDGADGTWMTGPEAVAMKLADVAEDEADAKKTKARQDAGDQRQIARQLFVAGLAAHAGEPDEAQRIIRGLSAPALSAGGRIQPLRNDDNLAPESPAPAHPAGPSEPEAMSNAAAKAKLQEKRRVLTESMNAIVAKAAARDDKVFSDAEQSEFDLLKAEIAKADRNIAIYTANDEINLAAAQPAPRIAQPEPPTANPGAPTIVSKRSSVATAGYTNLGEFAVDLYNATTTGQRSSRLVQLAASGYEGEKGGFFLPDAYQEEVVDATIKSSSLLARCTSPEIESRSIMMPVDEDEAHETTGMKAGTAGEGKTVTEGDVKIGKARVEVEKHEVKVKVPLELLSDARALQAFLVRKAQDKLDFQISDQIFRGNGVGQMLGILNAGALVTVAAESGQTADTVNAENIVNMDACLPETSVSNAVWLVSHALVSQIRLLSIKQTNQVIYTAPGQFPDQPRETLQGKPIIRHLVCSAPGDVGDIALVDLSQYFAPRLMGGVELRVYDQIGWDDDVIGFKWIFRVGGRPFRNKPSQVKYGTHKISPFVTLAAR